MECGFTAAAAVDALLLLLFAQGPVPIGAVHLSVSAWQQENPKSPLSSASLGQALHAAATEVVGPLSSCCWAPAVVGFEREAGGPWAAVRDGVVVVETAAAAVKIRWQQIAAERTAAAAKRQEKARDAKLQISFKKWRALFKAVLYTATYTQQHPLQLQQQVQQQQVQQQQQQQKEEVVSGLREGPSLLLPSVSSAKAAETPETDAKKPAAAAAATAAAAAAAGTPAAEWEII